MAPLPIDVPDLDIEDKTKQNEVKSILACLNLSTEQQKRIVNIFKEEMEDGLTNNPKKNNSLLMENTFVRKLTDGTEHGTFMALDLGGTNFRVILIHVNNGKVEKELVDYYEVPEPKRLGPGTELFDFLAECISDFMHKNTTNGHIYNLGFTFSFPMRQKGIRVGILTNWTKSFNCDGVVGHDAVNMLEEAMKRRVDLKNIVVSAVLNDTTGTLIQGSFLDKRCAIGMILGTGCNACYIEKTDKVEKWNGDPEGDELIIDIEWGSFGDNGCLDFVRTHWDNRVDEESLLRKSFTFEKYFAGKYLGDLVREVLLTLVQKGLLCGGHIGRLDQHGALKTSSITALENDTFSDEISGTKNILEGLCLTDPTLEDCKITQYVSGLISYRGVQLVCLLTGMLINRMDRPHCTIAIDGSLFKLHPRFKPLMEHLLHQYAPGKPFSLLLAKDGSGKGAAMLASIEDRLVRNGL